MSIWGKLAGAAAGLAIGGPIGALLGGVAGHYVIDRDQEQDGPAENQVAFTVGVIALGAKMARPTASSPWTRSTPSRKYSKCLTAR